MSAPSSFKARHPLVTVKLLVALLAALGVMAGAGCGSSTPSSDKAADTLVASFSDLGVGESDTETKCLADKVKPRLTGEDLKATAIADLSQEARVAVAGDVEACFSKEHVAALIPKVVAKEAGLTAAAAACVAKDFDGKVSYTALIRQERAAVDAIAKLARKCASAR